MFLSKITTLLFELSEISTTNLARSWAVMLEPTKKAGKFPLFYVFDGSIYPIQYQYSEKYKYFIEIETTSVYNF